MFICIVFCHHTDINADLRKKNLQLQQRYLYRTSGPKFKATKNELNKVIIMLEGSDADCEHYTISVWVSWTNLMAIIRFFNGQTYHY